MKHLTNLLFLSVFLLHFSCSSNELDGWEPDGEQEPGIEKKSISLGLSEATLSTFAASNITELGVYAYLNDSLVYGRNLPLNNGDLQIEVPLGENLRTFAVANAGEVTDLDSLSTVTIYQDATSQKEIYMSEVTSFISDRSVSTVNLELKRVVGQAVLQPTETLTQLTAVTSFDALNVVFNNAVIGYMPGANRYILGTVTVNTKIAGGYSASIYSFPTQGEDFGSIEVIYMKNEMEVNRTLRALDVTIQYEASKRTVVNMPILDGDYLQQPLSGLRRMGLKTSEGISIQEYQF